MANGLSIKKLGGETATNEDAAFMGKIAILCLLGDAMENAEANPGNIQEIAVKFFKMSKELWPNSGPALIRSTQYMAEDLGYSVQLDRNVQIGQS